MSNTRNPAIVQLPATALRLRGDHLAYLAGGTMAAAGLVSLTLGDVGPDGALLSTAQLGVLNLFAGYLTVAATLGGHGRAALRGLAAYSAAAVAFVAVAVGHAEGGHHLVSRGLAVALFGAGLLLAALRQAGAGAAREAGVADCG